MKYIKTYEALSPEEKDEFIKMKDEPSTTFYIDKLRNDCKNYNMMLMPLLQEMMLFKKITFKCKWCYNSDVTDCNSVYHNVIGICEAIKYENVNYWDSDILVRIENNDRWHTLFAYDSKYKTHEKNRVRIYNYTEGPKMQKLEMYKNVDKYNL